MGIKMYKNYVKNNFLKIIKWNIGCKKRKETRSSILLSDANKTKETRVKQASKVYHSRSTKASLAIVTDDLYLQSIYVWQLWVLGFNMP